MKDFEVYCNLELIVGEIDVGVKEGVVILLLGEGDVWKMLIRINFGIVGILVVYVEIQFSMNDLSLDIVIIDFLYIVCGSLVNIFGLLMEFKVLLENVGEVVFIFKRSGIF